MPGKRSNGEGTLRKRPNGLWECTMMVGYQEDGRRRYKSFYGKSQKEARDKAEAYKRDTAAGLYIDPNLTFQEWAQKWYEGYRDSVSPTTYESYGYTLKILVGAFGSRKLGGIKPLDVEQFLKSLRADGRSDSYLTKCRGMLYQIMHKAEANDLIRKKSRPLCGEDESPQAGKAERGVYPGGSQNFNGAVTRQQGGPYDPPHAGNGYADTGSPCPGAPAH